MVLFQYSYFCFLGFIASSFFSPTARTVFLVAGLALWALSFLQKQPASLRSLKVESIDWIYRFFLVYIVANLVLELIHSQSMMHWLKSCVSTYAQCFWCYFVIASPPRGFTSRSNPVDRPKLLQQTVIVVGGLLALIVVLQLVGLVPMAGNYYGILSQPFTSSGILLISFFLTLSSLRAPAKQSNAPTKPVHWIASASKPPLGARNDDWVLYLLMAFQFIAIFALGQRSTWLGVLLALLIYIGVQKLYCKKRFWFGLVTLALLGTLVSNASPRVQRKLEKFMQPQTWLESKTMQDRKQIWQINHQAWTQKIGFGIGKIVEYEGLKHAHNIYLQQLFCGGVFKFAAWLLLYLSIGLALVRLLGTQPEAFLAYLALSVEGLMENWWGDGEVLSLFVVLLVLALLKSKEKL